MKADELKQSQKIQELSASRFVPTVEPVRRSKKHPSAQSDGLSFSLAVEDDVKGSMQAVGQVCRAVLVGVLLFGFGGTAALLSVLLF